MALSAIVIALVGAGIGTARSRGAEVPPPPSATILHSLDAQGITVRPDAAGTTADADGVTRAVAAAHAQRAHVIGAALCDVQAAALHGDRWWVVVVDGVGSVPFGSRGDTSSRGTAVVFVDPDTLESTYELVF